MSEISIDYSRAVDVLEERIGAGQGVPGYFELLAIACHKPARLVRWCRSIDRRVEKASRIP